MSARLPGAGDPGPGRRPGALPGAWRPLLDRPALAGLLGDPLVDGALTEMHQLLPARVALHSLRTFLLADAYASARGIDYDRAGLLTATAFHDTGLTGNAPRTRGGFPCRSAELLEGFLARHGVDDGRRAVLARAVREHMRPFPARDASAEARLLHFGAWLDVTGRGGRRVPGERRRLAGLAPTPWFAVSFSARVAVSGLRGAPAGSPSSAR